MVSYVSISFIPLYKSGIALYLLLGGAISPTTRGVFFGSQREKGELADWEIPYEELTFVKCLGDIGPGEVHHAKWHGDVAVKVWTIDNPSEEMLRAFRREV